MAHYTFFRKLALCFLTGLVGAYAVFELSRKILASFIHILSGIAAVILCSAVAFAFVWHFIEKRRGAVTVSVISFMHSLLAWFIAIDLSMFACRKIFHLQFYAPQALTDKTVSSLSGEQLTIAYFGHSYAFGLCIAFLQLAGAALLIFGRTRLLGIFVLLPVLLNIILIDFFYDIEIGALFQAIALLLGLLYFLLCDYRRLLAFFFPAGYTWSSPHSRRAIAGYLLRSLVFLLPLFIAWRLYDPANRHPDLTGKYKVTKLLINSSDRPLHDCRDSALSLVYFDDNNDVVFQYGSLDRWRVGHFSFNKDTKALSVIWRYPHSFHDTLVASVATQLSPGNIVLQGVMAHDTIVAHLLKVK